MLHRSKIYIPAGNSNLSTAFISPMLPSCMRSRNCRPRFVYFFGDRNHEAKVGLDHFLFCQARFFLALLHSSIDFAEFANFYPEVDADVFILVAQVVNIFIGIIA